MSHAEAQATERIAYVVTRLHMGAWHILTQTPSRYQAASVYNNTEPPKRLVAIGKNGGTILHQKPE
jgi:hypothetical protein